MSNPSQDQPVEELEDLEPASMHEDLERDPEQKASREQQPSLDVDGPAPGDDADQERRGRQAMEDPRDPPELPSDQRDGGDRAQPPT